MHVAREDRTKLSSQNSSVFIEAGDFHYHCAKWDKGGGRENETQRHNKETDSMPLPRHCGKTLSKNVSSHWKRTLSTLFVIKWHVFCLNLFPLRHRSADTNSTKCVGDKHQQGKSTCKKEKLNKSEKEDHFCLQKLFSTGFHPHYTALIKRWVCFQASAWWIWLHLPWMKLIILRLALFQYKEEKSAHRNKA